MTAEPETAMAGGDERRRLSPEMMAEAMRDGEKAAHEDLIELLIGGERLLVRAGDVTEIVRPTRLTPVPMGPAHFLGLANIHGQIVCVIEASGVVNLPPTGEETPRTRFVVLRHPRMHVGIRVDAVPAMHRVPSSRIPADAAPEDPTQYSIATMEVGGEALKLLHVGSLLY
ncbi:MAG: chemotaxis protein CheW [Mariprofundaceae bacterium]